jgi:hypothetical protein
MTGQAAKLDMMATWRRAMALLKAHWTLFTAIAGPLVFLPLIAAFLRLSGSDVNWTSQNPVLVEQQLSRAVASDWWIYVLLYLGLILGQLTMYVLVVNHKRPTVGQAIALAAVMVPSFVVAWIAIQMATELPKQLVLAIAPSLVWTSVIFSIIGLFLTVRMYVLTPIYALGESLNPVVNIRRSWTMTAGNGWPIFGLMVLVGIGSFISGMIIWAVLSLMFGLILPASSAPTMMLTLLAVVFMLVTILFVALNVAIYEELASTNEG